MADLIVAHPSLLCNHLQAAGLSVPNDASWTIFAPTNKVSGSPFPGQLCMVSLCMVSCAWSALCMVSSTTDTTLLAVSCAPLPLPSSHPKAFEDARIADRTGLSAKQLLEPANKKALTQVGAGGSRHKCDIPSPAALEHSTT